MCLSRMMLETISQMSDDPLISPAIPESSATKAVSYTAPRGTIPTRTWPGY